VFIIVGTLVFGFGKLKGNLVREKAEYEGEEHEEVEKSNFKFRFNPLVYSIDLFFPIINFHEAENWTPTNKSLRLYLWIHITAGWFCTTILILGMAGFIK